MIFCRRARTLQSPDSGSRGSIGGDSTTTVFSQPGFEEFIARQEAAKRLREGKTEIVIFILLGFHFPFFSPPYDAFDRKLFTLSSFPIAFSSYDIEYRERKCFHFWSELEP